MSGQGAVGDAPLAQSPGKLDVTSEHFDAAECLTVADPSTVSLPFPNIQQLDNFKHCENLVPPALRAEVKQALGTTVCPLPQPVEVLLTGTSVYSSISWRILNRSVPCFPASEVCEQEKTEEQKRKDAEKRAFLCKRAVQYMDAVHEAATRDPIEQIAKRVRKGPLMLLKRAYQAACEIDITTRHARGVRGVLRATLHGFDKYMNMLLADGHEMFVVRQRVFRLKSTSPEEEASKQDSEQGSQPIKTRVGWKQVLRQRKLARIMLRGDQVVTIAFAQGEPSLPPCLAHVQSIPIKEEGD